MNQSFFRFPSQLIVACVCSVLVAFGCGPALPAEQEWPGDSKRWYDRAVNSYQTLDVEDARAALTKALQAAPQREEAQLLGARIALAQLDYEAALEFAQGLTTSEAHSVRGQSDRSR